MRTQDPIAPGDDILTLLAARARVTHLPTDRLGRIAATMRLVRAAVRVIAEVTACLASWDADLLAHGIVTKPCQHCGDRCVVASTGQPRAYCRDACRQAGHRERADRPTSGVPLAV